MSKSHERTRGVQTLWIALGGAAACWASLLSLGAHTKDVGARVESAKVEPPPSAEPVRVPQVAPRAAPLLAPLPLAAARTDEQTDSRQPESPSEAEQRRIERGRFATYFAKLDALRGAERDGRAWQREIEASASEVMASTPELQQSKLSSVECGASLCKVVATHEDPMAQEIFQHYFLRGMGLTASVQYLDGSSTVYLARSEEALPSFD